jgi:hypothetical protein
VSKGLAEKGVSFNAADTRRVTLAQAYCLFFCEHLKHNPKVFRILVTDTLNEMRGNLDTLGPSLTGELKALHEKLDILAAAPSTLDFTKFEQWLEPQLGAIKDLLTDVKTQLDAVARGQRELADKQGEILVAITTLRAEVARGNPAAQPLLDEVSAFIARFERKLDYAIAGLPIQRFEPPEPPTHELELLQAKHRAVDLVGRDEDLAALWQWSSAGDAISARLLVGGAGRGKTRLALELLRRVNAELPAWQAGLLTGSALRKFDATKQPADWTWPVPTLLVVDYAQTLAGPLAELLRALTHKRRASGLPPLRILLLERQPGDWFEALLREADSGGPCPLRSLFHPATPVPLTPLPEGELRRKVLVQTLEKAAKFTGKPPPALPPEGDRDCEASLKRDLFAEPLNLMLAAVAARELGLSEALERPRDDLVFFVAEREERRLSHYLPKEDKDPEWPGFRHSAVGATICQGWDESEALPVAEQESKALGYQFSGGIAAVLRTLGDALSNTRPHRIAGVVPDLVGEAFSYAVLTRELSENAQRECISRLAAKLGHRVLGFLLRALYSFPGTSQGELAIWINQVREILPRLNLDVASSICSLIPPEAATSPDRAAFTQRLLDSFETKVRLLSTSSLTEDWTSQSTAWLRKNIDLAITIP